MMGSRPPVRIGKVTTVGAPPGGATTVVTFPILTGGLLPFIQQRMAQQAQQLSTDHLRF